ncbi:MAG: hypothetical protein IBX68_11445 [Dehalococcoidia bacterium]|nr:hypothetical protein [Dehalococcoidia bacterium]
MTMMEQEDCRRGSGQPGACQEGRQCPGSARSDLMLVLEPDMNSLNVERIRERTLRRLGYRRGKATDSAILNGIGEGLRVAAEAVQPRAAYRVLPVLEAGGDSIETEAGPINSARFARLVRMCAGQKAIVFMLATVGPALEKACDSSESLFQKVVYDALGSECAETIADWLEEECESWAERSGLKISARFSPGYCDWALDGQRTIFHALDTEKAGVRLSAHCAMEPVKSVSSIAVAAESVPYRNPCILCPKKDCRWRRTRQELEAGIPEA